VFVREKKKKGGLSMDLGNAKKYVLEEKTMEACERRHKDAILELLEMLHENFPYPYCEARDYDPANVRNLLNLLFLYKLITKAERDRLIRYFRMRSANKEKKRVAT
jgi:hypothetical protein